MGDGAHRLLVVEDDPILRMALGRYLGATWAVETVATVAAGRARLAAARFGIVLCDFSLPDGTAADVVAALDAAAAARVVVATGDPRHPSCAALRDAAPCVWLVKPFDCDALEAALAQAVLTPAAPGGTATSGAAGGAVIAVRAPRAYAGPADADGWVYFLGMTCLGAGAGLSDDARAAARRRGAGLERGWAPLRAR